MNSNKTVVCDIDGTLSNLDHRLHYVKGKKKDYDSFYAEVGGDKLNEWCADLLDSMYWAGYNIALVSGRRKETEADTILWLTKNAVRYHQLHLLGTNGKSDVETKGEWLATQNKAGIVFAVDDRKRIVDLYRKEGLTVLQCNDWEERGL